MEEKLVLNWLKDRKLVSQLQIEVIKLTEMRSWDVLNDSLVHETGRFFSIIGIRQEFINSNHQPLEQPIILQPEIGILGFIIRYLDEKPQILVQAKAEPGNVGDVQMAPTVQATVSNYMRLHGGAPTPYLSYFTEAKEGINIADSLQSEQGTRFLGKYNRNSTVLVKDDNLDPVSDFWRWCDLDVILKLVQQDFLINTDARSVFSCSNWELLVNQKPFSRWQNQNTFGTQLWGSFNADETNSEHNLLEILNRLQQWRKESQFTVNQIPLKSLSGWKIDELKIIDSLESHFQVQAYRIHVQGREVEKWCQPLVESLKEGLVVLFCQMRRGILHFLFKNSIEMGFREFVQLSATIQYDSFDKSSSDSKQNDFFYRLFQSSTDTIEHVSCLQSDEGGRFYCSVVRYCVREVKENISIPDDDSFFWLTLKQVYDLLKIRGIFNNEARSAISLLLGYL